MGGVLEEATSVLGLFPRHLLIPGVGDKALGLLTF